MVDPYRPWRAPQSAQDWAIYRAAYDDASRRRTERGEVGDHIGDKFEAMEFLYKVSPPRRDPMGHVTYVHPAEMARQRVERAFAKLAVR